MKTKVVVAVVFLVVCSLLAVSYISAAFTRPRRWVDVSGQSPNIFTNADSCPTDHPAEIWVLDSKYDSVGHHIRVCGQYNSKGEVVVSDENGRIINK